MGLHPLRVRWDAFLVFTILIIIALVLVGIVAAVFVYRNRRTAAMPPDLATRLEQLGRLASRSLAGEVLVDTDYEAANNTFQDLYQLFEQVHGTENNLQFSGSDRVRFMIEATKIAALEHPDHNAWPLCAPIRRRVSEGLSARLEQAPDDWTHLAAIMPALVLGDPSRAARSYGALSARSEMQRLALRWARDAIVGHRAANDESAAIAFLAEVGAPLTTEPYGGERTSFDEAKKWALALGIYRSWAWDARESLRSTEPPAVARLGLKKSWSVDGAGSARERLGWLLEEGHSAGVRYLLAGEALDRADPRESFLATHRTELERYSGVAWDLCRLVQVARSAVSAEYIPEKEGWSWILHAALVARRTYPGWHALGDDYLLGAAYFCAPDGGPPDEHVASVEWLKTSDCSPWRSIPWEIDQGRLG